MPPAIAAPDAAFGKARRGHARVVHAHHRHAHDQGCQAAGAQHAGAFSTQRERDPQRRTRSDDRDHDRQGEPARVVVDARLHAHRFHADVVHGRDTGAEDQRRDAELACRQIATGDHIERIGRAADRDQQRVQRDCEVIPLRNRQLERQHAEEVHRPDAEAHCDRATDQPAARRPAVARRCVRPCRGQHRRRTQPPHTKRRQAAGCRCRRAWGLDWRVGAASQKQPPCQCATLSTSLPVRTQPERAARMRDPATRPGQVVTRLGDRPAGTGRPQSVRRRPAR